ncbi:hypothetical protein N0V95_002367 [Ascochyta clinopodiicola]|nr:hypothetical protein N0V95_002367 [Ascochyta clinopodiicola]
MAERSFLDNWRTLSEELKLQILEYTVTLRLPRQAHLPCYYHLDDHRYWNFTAFSDLVIPLLSIPELKTLVQEAFYTQHSFSLNYDRKWNTESQAPSLSVRLPQPAMRGYVRRLHMVISGFDRHTFGLLSKAPSGLAQLPNLSLLEISVLRLGTRNEYMRQCVRNGKSLAFRVKCLRIAYRQYRGATAEAADMFEMPVLQKFTLAAAMEGEERLTRFVVGVPEGELREVESWAASAAVEHQVRWTTKEVVAKEFRFGRYPKFQPQVD